MDHSNYSTKFHIEYYRGGEHPYEDWFCLYGEPTLEKAQEYIDGRYAQTTCGLPPGTRLRIVEVTRKVIKEETLT